MGMSLFNQIVVTIVILSQVTLYAKPNDTLMKLIPIDRELPQSELALAKSIQEDFEKENFDLIHDLTLSTSPELIRAFVEALEKGDDGATLEKLLSEINNQSASSARFLVALNDRIEKNPQVYSKIYERMQRLEKSLNKQRIPFPNYGERTVNGVAYLMGMVAFLYSFNTEFLGGASTDAFINGLGFAPGFFALYLVSVLGSEAHAMKMSLSQYLKERRVLKNNKKVLKDLLKYTEALRNSPRASATVELYRYYSSDQAQKDLQKILPGMIAENLKELESLRANKYLWERLTAFSKTRAMEELVSHLGSTLTESEKALLRNDLRETHPDFALAISTNEKIKNFEVKTRQAFQKFLRTDGNHSVELHRSILEKKKEISESMARSYEMSRIQAWAFATNGLSIAIIGLYAAVGTHHSEIDVLFGHTIIDWVRGHTSLMFYVTGLLALPSIARFYWKMGQMAKLKNNYKMFPSTEGSELQLKLLDISSKIITQTIQYPSTQLPNTRSKAYTADAIIEDLLEHADLYNVPQFKDEDFLPPTCHALFN
jgi:hypothetical protein